jgi:hypothetical protein
MWARTPDGILLNLDHAIAVSARPSGLWAENLSGGEILLSADAVKAQEDLERAITNSVPLITFTE